MLASTLESAVDAFSITLLPKAEVHQVAVYQSLGWNVGYFLSYTIFLALSSSEFCNKWLRTNPAEQGMISLEGYIMFCGFFFLLCTVAVLCIAERDQQQQQQQQQGGKSNKHLSVWEVYVKIVEITLSPQMRFLVFVLLVEKIAFVVVDSAYMLRLIQKGFKKEDMSTIVLLTLPCEVIFPVFIGKLIDDQPLFSLWTSSYRWNLVVYTAVTLAVATLPPSNPFAFWIVLLLAYLFSLSNNIMYLTQSAVFVKICDPSISATYISLLNTISNLGTVWPVVFAMMLIDTLSAGGEHCSEDGPCEFTRDGFSYVSFLFLFLGLLFTLVFHRRLTETQSLWHTKV